MSIVDFSGLAWRKSSRSGQNGSNGNCVEIAFAVALPWRKSSRSGQNGSNDACIEVAHTGPVVALRDSKSPTTGALAVPAPSFASFIRGL